MTQAKPKAKGQLRQVVEHLQKPIHLRISITGVLLVSWYFAVDTPIEESISVTTRQVAQEKKRLGLALEIEKLRKQVSKFEGRLPQKTDPNEWVQYMLEGVRAYPLKLVLLDTDKPRDLGPYKAIVVRLTLEGGYRDINAFLRWVESNPRLLRIDSVRLEPKRNDHGVVAADLIVLGVMG
jgi:Tfp pilus assembly protein PilO